MARFCFVLMNCLVLYLSCPVYSIASDASSAGNAPTHFEQSDRRPRLLILTDIGGDPDDQQSMRRLMLYANEFRIVGLIASASGIPGELKDAVVQPQLIHEIIDDYAKVRDNLAKHAPGYPTAEELRAVVKSGNPHRGVKNVGKGHSTEGSNHIIAAVDAASEDDPVCIAIWGGATELAQALHDVAATRTANQTRNFLRKIHVYAIGDQDATRNERGTGQWVRKHFPDLRYIESGPPGSDIFTAAYRGMYQNDSQGGSSPSRQLVLNEIIVMNQRDWVEENIRKGHGPLGAHYPLVVQNPSSRNNRVGVKEGDTPSWFYFLRNGLNDPAQPTWGGWGGRFRHDEWEHFIDDEDDHWSGSKDPGIRRRWTVARWRKAYQNDFAARMDWCVESPAKANHPPKACVFKDATLGMLKQRVEAGKQVTLDARASSDPDGDALQFNWWIYHEPSTYKGKVTVVGGDSSRATVHIPDDAAGTTIHVILEVTDNGVPSLTSFRRVVLFVEKK